MLSAYKEDHSACVQRERRAVSSVSLSITRFLWFLGTVFSQQFFSPFVQEDQKSQGPTLLLGTIQYTGVCLGLDIGHICKPLLSLGAT